MLGLSVLDWLLLFVVLLNVLGAIGQGFFYELFSFAGVIVGYLIAAWQYPRMAAFYVHYVNSEWAAQIAGFLTIFVAVVVLGGVAGKTARSVVREVGLRFFDRLLGGLFGFLKGLVIATVVVIALAAFSPSSPWVRDSRIAPFLLVTGRTLIWVAPADLRQRFRDGWNLMRTVPEHIEHPGGGDRN
ncbi:MAG TPA: CvpA family protein [Candidatus Angelobacter sp.]|jgi:membrane protein required for colicin V production|nr:CvpA family protein [Candidatus Angelobacter sp.]